MNRAVGVALAALSSSCGSLPTTTEGVAFLQVEQPANRTINVGDSLQLHALALDKRGSPLDVPIHWRTPDSTITVGETTGLVIGVKPDSGHVQAVIGADELVSDFITVLIKKPAAALRRE